MAELEHYEVNLHIPNFGVISGTWLPDSNEQQAAWEMYVELVTRVPVVRLHHDEGFLEEALDSLYTLFDLTRNILHKYGPEIAQPKGNGTLSFGYLSVTILNVVLRPVLAKYHPLLVDYKGKSGNGVQVSPLEHERNWEKNSELRETLNRDVRGALVEYADLLARVAKVPSLIVERVG